MANALQIAMALAAVLVAALLARQAAALVRQPPVIGEIAVGLILVPALSTAAGPDLTTALLPPDVQEHLRTIGTAGLALYLTGVGHSARPCRSEVPPRSYAWLLAGSLLPGLAAGALLAAWVVWRGDPGERGTAPTMALILLLAAALAVTAVPVLVRVLTDRGMRDTSEGRLSVLTAVAIDALTWLLVAAALAAASGGGRHLARALVVIVGGAGAAGAARLLLRQPAVSVWCQRWPTAAVAVLGVVTIAAARATEAAGLTAIYGAVLVGLAMPWEGRQGPRSHVVHIVEGMGRLLVPAFFVTAGLTLSTKGPVGFSWWTMILTVLLASAAKLAGGYAGARAAQLPTGTALRFAVLMNTRGLTEIAVLQAGMSAGILTPGLFFVLVVMALVTTAATGPLLSLTAHPPLLQLRPTDG
ncbi:cation:proton antiporter [Streptomyces niger]|uniref:cation:proton antiporter n=1 Tax=Streptomyces niger TaxID=66373 RepID=UPI00069B383A|nr:cation:proton antiporter [Streptomyces niger]